MRDLDETDLEILRLLVEDARRPYSEIADAVDLSAPAVSDRISRLREVGVIRRFTLDLDRSQLSEGVAVLVEFDVDSDGLDDVRRSLRNTEAVEHLFTTAEGHLVANARVPNGTLREWLRETVDLARVDDYEVTLLSRAEWTPSVDGADFALACAECDNTVTSEGVASRIDGTLYNFCCSSCEARFRERYERLSEGAES